MFRLEKNSKTSKLGERIDFNFSDFQALQVPKGWDKLIVSLISVETGKTIAKSSKALARNGNCQWTEILSESLCLPQYDSSNDLEEYLYKLVVSMGSARSGILGEATVNMASYMSSRQSAPVSLPLKKCSYGTILQVKIDCLTPRTKLRDEESKYSNFPAEDQDADTHDVGSKSNGFGDSFSRSLRSPSSQDLGSTSLPGKMGSMESNFSASGSNHSFNPANGSVEIEIFSARNDLNGHSYNRGGRRVAASLINSSPHENYPADDPFISNHSSFNSRTVSSGNDLRNHGPEYGQSPSPVIATSSLPNVGSSKNLLEAAEDTIEELRTEAKMWERDARRLMLDLDILRKKFSDQSKREANLEMELSAACTERDGVKKESEHLKILLEESMAKQTANEDSIFQSERVIHIQKELQNELKFQQESNANLAIQFRGSQESNIELLSVLQELEETIENQKVEIENLSEIQLKFNDLEKSIKENSEENKSLQLQLQQLQESEKSLEVNIQLLEQALEDKNNEVKNERSLNIQSLLDIEREYKCKLSVKEEKIVSLEAKLSESITQLEEMGFTNESGADLMREIEALKEKVRELERDCSELTNENLDFLCKLKESKSNCIINESEVKELKSQIHRLEEEIGRKVIEINERNNSIAEAQKQLEDYVFKIQELESANIDLEANLTDLGKEIAEKGSEVEKLEVSLLSREEEIDFLRQNLTDLGKEITENRSEVGKLEASLLSKEEEIDFLRQSLTDLGKEIAEKRSEVGNLEATLQSKEEEIDFLRQCQMELEVQASDLGKEKEHLQEEMEIALRESKITTKCVDDLRNDLTVLNSSVDSHVSANKILERKSSELENRRRELELHLFEVEEENVQLSESISDLEAQLRHVKGDRESIQLELENSKSFAVGLQDEVERLAIEMETQKMDLEQKLKDTENIMSGVQEECEYLKIANQELQAYSESLVEECNTLRKSNEDFHEHCTNLETELIESRKSLSECSERIESLEENISSMVEDFASKEKSLTSELDTRIQENRQQKEKLMLEQSLLNQKYLEKKAEVENLLREVSELESSLQEARSTVKMTEHELDSLRMESELKVQDLMVEFSASKQSHGKMSKLLANYRSREDKLKTAVNDLELKLTVSEYERQQLIEETANLKAKLQKISHLQDEVLALKKKLNESNFEKEKLEALLNSISGDYEELKTERISSLENVSSLQKGKIALEEKLTRMEGDLTSKEALYAEETEQRNEVGRIKRANKQYQRKVQQLEEDKNECLKRSQALEKDLRLLEEARQSRSKYGGKTGDNENGFHDGSPHAVGMDSVAKVQLLENDLAEALEANNKYKIQLQRFSFEGQNSNSASPNQKPKAEGEVVPKERYERTKSSLETELKEIHDRYFQMSLKYAEVEAEREDLVMMLKASKSGKSWFS